MSAPGAGRPFLIPTSDRPTLTAAVRLADTVFVTSRGHAGSTRSRYPAAYAPRLGGAVHAVADNAGTLISMACARRFRLKLPGTGMLHGRMIGLVCTAEAHRRGGHATRILEAIEVEARREGLDFLVLWSGQGPFYQARGWQALDEGLFGRRELDAGTRAGDGGAPPMIGNLAAAERIRRADKPVVPSRARRAWRAVPLPCRRVDLLTHGASHALVGRAPDQASIVFELGGTARDWDRLWPAMAAGTRTLLANSDARAPSHGWLSERIGTWTPQRLAHWRLLSERARAIASAAPTIPYIDRI